MSQHTPGPWQYRLDSTDIVIETQPYAEDVAVIHSVATGILGGQLDNANARLIAAAPRMETFLRALDRLWTLQAGHYASLDTDRQELRDILAEIDGIGAEGKP